MTTATQQTVRSLMLIGGKAVESSDGRYIDIENPATRTVIAQVPRGTDADVDSAVRAAAAAHLARTVCRRAERSVVALGEKEKVGEPARRYLNRLSDLLFIAGRRLNRHAGRTDVQWRHERKKR